MNNLQMIIKLLFHDVSSREILEGKVWYWDITSDLFQALGNAYWNYYSGNEIRNIYQYLSCQLNGHVDVFQILNLYNRQVLEEIAGYPVCRFDRLMEWRESAFELEEDLFTTSFLAAQDMQRFSQKKRTDFNWKVVIGNDNSLLNHILQQGMAENHFHLKGSAPYFPLAWMNLMNLVNKKEFHVILRKYDENRLQAKRLYHSKAAELPLTVLHMQAAWIRLFLYHKIKRREQRLWEEVQEKEEELLKNTEVLLSCRSRIQSMIREIAEEKARSVGVESRIFLDYAIELPDFESKIFDEKKFFLEDIEYLSGERYFLYTMFRAILERDRELMPYANWFYAYLVIKEQFRSELIQNNGVVGFDNFLKYQDRKEDFIDGTGAEKIFKRLAVKNTLKSQSIKKLEARITPRNSAFENFDYIKKMDRDIGEVTEGKKFFYVFHFVKEGDTKESESDYICRHNKKRKEVKRQAKAIALFRQKYLKEAMRVYGIDACSPEIGCRPEVFAQAFRFLRCEQNCLWLEKEGRIPRLGISYHVGEDFLDMIDGLRAIDEAMMFLNMGHGDRFGHALALGVSPFDWYLSKNYKILIPKQDHLDNIVWLHEKIRKYGITGMDTFLLTLEREYVHCFNYIYRESFQPDAIWNRYDFDINVYYDAWKLRGDFPECYFCGSYEKGEIYSEWDRYNINERMPELDSIRKNPETTALYYLYHYSEKVKKKGKEIQEISVNFDTIKAVAEVQKKLQREVQKKGICIETNPSSNCLIGTFKAYEKHPIKNFYNLGLTNNREELENCPQLQVSINTDDQGVFCTSLENEYALVALALEKQCDKDGNLCYNKTMIYEWLDRIREMGLRHSFWQGE